MQDKSDLISSNGSTSEAAMIGQHLHSEYVRIPTVPCMAVENEKDFADSNDYPLFIPSLPCYESKYYFLKGPLCCSKMEKGNVLREKLRSCLRKSLLSEK